MEIDNIEGFGDVVAETIARASSAMGNAVVVTGSLEHMTRDESKEMALRPRREGGSLRLQ